MATELICLGDVTYIDQMVQCTEWAVRESPLDLPEAFSLLQITALNILFVMTWGIGAILLPWSIGFVVGIAKKVISTA